MVPGLLLGVLSTNLKQCLIVRRCPHCPSVLRDKLIENLPDLTLIELLSVPGRALEFCI